VKRTCGDCTLCCRLLPVNSDGLRDFKAPRVEVHKAAGERCRFQRHGKGCSVYAGRPVACELWSCRWLVDDEAAGLSRPDRSHYVVDVMPDQIIITVDGKSRRFEVLQVWVDPAHRDAHRDPALRAYIDKLGVPAIIRYDSTEGFVLFPPSASSDGQWHEQDSKIHPTKSAFEAAAEKAEARP
jgi:hypothetical protein